MQSGQGYMININTCPKVKLTCIPGIGDAIAARIMDMREKGINIDRDVLSQIPHMRVTEGTLGIIDFSPRPQAEVSEASCGRAGSVSMSTPKPDHVIIDMDPEECQGTDLKGTNISCISEYEAPPYHPVPRDRRTEDQKQIAHLQDFNSNIRQWLEECDTQDEFASSCSEEGACSSLEWVQRRLEQPPRHSEHSAMLEQCLYEPPQESLSTESLNSELENLSVCENSEYRTPSPRTNMVVRPQPDSQQERDVQKQPNDRMFSPLSQNWHIPHPVVDQQEDCNRQQEVQQTPPRYNSPAPIIDYNQQPRFIHTPTFDRVHFSPIVQHEQHRQQEVNSPLQQSFSVEGQPTTPSNFAQLQKPIFQHSQHTDVNQYQHGYNSPHRLEIKPSQPTVQSQTDVHSHLQLSYLQQQNSCPTNQQQGVNKVQQPLLPAQQSVQMQQQVQGLQQRLDQLQLGVINYAQPVRQQHPAAAPVSSPQQQLQQQQQVSAVVHQQPTYQEPRFQPPSSVPRTQPPKMIGHPTSMFLPPRGGPPPQAPTNIPPYNQQYISGLTYPSLGQPTLSGYQPQPLHVPYQQLPIPGTQQQPPTSGAPQPHYNQPSSRPKEYNSDYYVRKRRSDPGQKYTGDSDTSDVSTYRQTRNKRRSRPDYNRPREDQQRDFSPIRKVRSSPLHRIRNSPRRSRGSNDSKSESDTDGQCSKSSQESRKKEKIEKRQFLSSIPRTLRYHNDTDAHHTPENETAILLGHQVSQLAESQVEPSSSQPKSIQSSQVPKLVVIQYEGLQCMARVSSMTELYTVVTERFPESGECYIEL
ncbi:unnamed protein product [Mytilus coruscus]|uniref:Uncharacterized protein n=1 Tax=Mytilus coruscus TaxID=42192 RepID=A0A6J8C7E6_MYTCO|nr:unnamed protein product [Mytilus coruscus]